jgi:hypothetical protein
MFPQQIPQDLPSVSLIVLIDDLVLYIAAFVRTSCTK